MHILARTHSNPLHQTKNKTKLTAAFLIVHINSVLKKLKILYVYTFLRMQYLDFRSCIFKDQ